MRGLANGHRRRSAAEWHGIIERYRQSGQGMNEFCAQVRLPANIPSPVLANPSKRAGRKLT